jgi:3-phenylpropionate/trans-cinnamate dioxygenase ferredoxin subunit
VSDAGYLRVGAAVEIPEGELRAYELPARRVAVARVDGRLYGIGDECPVGGCSLAEDGAVSPSGDAVTCSRDGSAFDLETGEPIDGPAVDRVPIHAVRVDNGWIEIATAADDG